MENVMEIIIDAASAYGFVHLVSGIRLIESVTVDCRADLFERAKLTLDFEPALFLPVKLDLGVPRVGKRVLDCRLTESFRGALLGERGLSLRIKATVRSENAVYAETQTTVPLLGYDVFDGAYSYPGLCAAWVEPDSRVLRDIARDICGEGSRSPYERFGPTGITALAKSAYEAVKGLGLAYAVHRQKGSQQIRGVARCVAEKNASALELALLEASLAEAMGLHADVIFFRGAVALGIHLKGDVYGDCEKYDVGKLREFFAAGKYLAVDPLGVCYGTDIPFSVSCDGGSKLLGGGEFTVAVDVAGARRAGIDPLPAELFDVGGEAPSRDILAENGQLYEAHGAPGFRERLFGLPGAALLRDCPADGEEVDFSLAREGAELILSPDTPDPCCIGVGEVKYRDRLEERVCRAPAALMKLVRKGDGRFFVGRAAVNAALFDRLSDQYGFDSASARAALAEGVGAFMDKMESDAALSDGFEVARDCRIVSGPAAGLCFALAPETASAPDTVPPEIPCAFGESCDGDLDHALKLALKEKITAVSGADGGRLFRLGGLAALSALKNGSEVLWVSRDPGSVAGKISALEVSGGSDPRSVSRLEALTKKRPQGLSFHESAALCDIYGDAPAPVRISPALFASMDGALRERWDEAVERLAETAENAGGVPSNPLGRVSILGFREGFADGAADAAARCCGDLTSYLDALEASAQLLEVPSDFGFDAAGRFAAALSALAEGEDLSAAYFENRLGDTPETVRTFKKYYMLREELERSFTPDVFRLDAAGLRTRLRGASNFSGLKRASVKKGVVNELRSCASSAQVDSSNAGEWLDKLDTVAQYADYVGKNAGHLRACFGVDVTSPDTDLSGLWDRLEGICGSSERLERAYMGLREASVGDIPQVLRIPGIRESAAAALKSLDSAKKSFDGSYGTLTELLKLKKTRCADLAEEKTELEALRDGMGGLDAWCAWLRAMTDAVELGLEDAAAQCESGLYDRQSLKANYRRGFYASLCEYYLSETPVLREEGRTEPEAAGIRAADGISLDGLEVMSLWDALADTKKRDLVIAENAGDIDAALGESLLKKGGRVLLLGRAPFAERDSLLGFACAGGAMRAVLGAMGSGDVRVQAAAAGLARRDGGPVCAPAFAGPSSVKAAMIPVKGGFDPAAGSNLIEASVLAEELKDCVDGGVESVSVVTLGEAQKRLFMRVLAGKLSRDPDFRDKLLNGYRDRFWISSFDEDPPEADAVLLSLCFSGSDRAYNTGMSPALFGALKDGSYAKLAGILSLPKRFLTFTCSFGTSQLSGTASANPQASGFRRFAAALFSLCGSPAGEGIPEDRPCGEATLRIARELTDRGHAPRTFMGFGKRILADILLEDGSVILWDDTLAALSRSPAHSGEYLRELNERGVRTYVIDSARRFFDSAAVTREILRFAEGEEPEDNISAGNGEEE